VLHVGCGVGYYTALAARAVAPGEVAGVELDAALAERARRNLAAWPNVRIVTADGSQLAAQPCDAILVNAGATEPLPAWVDALRTGGRLMLPLTVDLPMPGVGAGHMLRLVRRARGFDARFVSPVAVFHCAGARTCEGVRALRHAYARRGEDRVRSLRRDAHSRAASCWLHADRFCLSFDPARDE
jgi:protein-L-isoaspartate(D-aspartate) O-methyltransferase